MKKFCQKAFIILTPTLLSLVTLQAHALNSPGIAHPPYHIKPNTKSNAPSGFTPAQIRQAYNFGDYQGAGQTIGIVDAFDDPNIEADLGVFSTQFNLPACTSDNGCFKKVYATGKKPKKNAGWAVETSLDVEWAHAVAPQAKIILVETANASMNALMKGVQVAVQQGADVISMSWGGSEFSTESSFDSMFDVQGVTFTAASGDNGTGTIYPAASPNVLAVGGTSLKVDANGNYASETAWSGSGGGMSSYEPAPISQSKLPIPNNPNNMRGMPDVSYNADPNTGYSVYDSVPSQGQKGWFVVGGTSAASPQWAAMIADANSALGKNLNGTSDLLYSFAKGSQYDTDFHDVNSGTNGTCGYYCTARTGYDYVTGLGTPQVPNLINELINNGFSKKRFNV